MEDEPDQTRLGLPAVGVGQYCEQAHTSLIHILELLDEQSFEYAVFFEEGGEEVDYGFDEAGTGVVVETRDDFVDDGGDIVVVAFDFDDRLDDFEVLG